MTVFKLQIVTAANETVATFQGRGPVERDLVQALTAGILAKGSWWLRRSKLEAAIAAGIEDVLMDVKREVATKYLG